MKRRIFALLLTLALLAGLCPLSVFAAVGEGTTEKEIDLLASSGGGGGIGHASEEEAGDWLIVDGIEEGKIRFDSSTGAITDCENTVTKADIPETIDGVIVTSIGEWAFDQCSDLTSINIPSSIETIGDCAFCYCSGLTGIVIPPSVTTMGEQVFFGCEGMTNIDIQANITDIESEMFYDCCNLVSVTLPASVTSIGNEVFRNCDSLESIILPNNVTTIEDSAFSYCGLTSITIPKSVTEIGNEVFYYCTSLENIKVEEENYNYSSLDGVLFDKSQEILLAYPAAKEGSYTIPISVTSVGDSAFSWCKIKSISIPGYVTDIGDYAFDGCDEMESITLSEGVQTIGEGAFRNCESLLSISIPASVTSIGDEAFVHCNSLTKINIAENNPNYSSIDGVLFNKAKTTLLAYPVNGQEEYTVPDGITTIGDYAFESCNVESVTISETVTTIGDCTFYFCFNLTSVAIPNSVTTIGEFAFTWCSFTSITIPDSVTNIGACAFYLCDSLTNIIIPASITNIEENMFEGCSSLTNIFIPASVTSIGDEAFRGCDSLKNVYYDGSEDQWSEINIGYVNYFLHEATIHYGEEFSTDEGWYTVSGVKDGKICFDSSTGTITDCEETVTEANIPATINDVDVTSIGERAFYDCDSLTSVTIPNSVKSIGDYAFDWCECLTSITIPDSVTSIGEGAFWLCDSLTSIIIPNSVTSIGEGAFCNCTNLTSLSIPASVTSVGNRAFCNCASLTSIQVSTENPNYTNLDGVLFNKTKTVLIEYPAGKSETSYTIPDGVTSIGELAFESCNNLTSITIPNSVTNIENWAFLNCDSLTSITIPDSVTSIGYSVFRWCDSLMSVTISDSVTSIGDDAFYGCSSLTSITIPSSVTNIGDMAFAHCESLTSTNIPDNVISIGNYAFTGCDSLTSINVSDGNSEYSSLDGVLFNKAKTTLITYPAGKSATSYTIPASITSIRDWAFRNNDSLTSIIIPDSVTSIESWMFYDCDNLESITIPAGVTSIGYWAFSDCDSLTNVYYSGSRTMWNTIDISDENDSLMEANLHCDVVGSVSNIRSELGEKPDRAEILNALADLNSEDLRIAIAADTEDSGIVSALEELEEVCGGQAKIDVDTELADTFDVGKVSIVGANLNQLSNDSENTTLNITKAAEKDVNETVYNNTVAVSFSMDIENVEDTENLDVPVKITLPVPTDINPAFLVILHYLKSSGMEEIHPYVWQDDTEQWYATFVLTSFSDFVFTEYNSGLQRDDSEVQYINNSNEALEGVRFVVARYDTDGKFLGSEVSEEMTVKANTIISYTIKTMGDKMKIMLVDENYKPLTASIS